MQAKNLTVGNSRSRSPTPTPHAAAGREKPADQELLAWQSQYGAGLISHNQADQSLGAGMPSLQDQLAEILKNKFGIAPKRGIVTYSKPYPEVYDQLPPPPKFKVLEFSKFSGNDNTSTVEPSADILLSSVSQLLPNT